MVTPGIWLTYRECLNKPLMRRFLTKALAFILVIVALYVAYNLIFSPVRYDGIKQFNIESLTEKELTANITVSLYNSLFFDVHLTELNAGILGADKKIGEFEIDSSVVLLALSSNDIPLKMKLGVKEAAKFLNQTGDTLRVVIKGKAKASIGFISYPVNLDFPVSYDAESMGGTGEGTSGGNSSIGDSLIQFKGVKNLTLKNDSLKFDVVIELNNPWDIGIKFISIDSGLVYLEDKLAGSVTLSEQVSIPKKTKGTESILVASCYVGDLLKAGVGTAWGVVTKAGVVSYELRGRLKVKVAGEVLTIPIKYRGKLNLKEKVGL
ncbi:MAG: hypothetical protein IFNCLDLE_01260 [Ignavibacteriaceae bacterium]|nr:hypothetical protein [Ignavibacteriaceae bacterium]